jgi:antitoxin HicB
VGKNGDNKNKGENRMKKAFTVMDGKLVLKLEPAEEGGYIVTSPLDPELITEAESLEEAFVNARDALQALRQSRAKLLRKLSVANLR